MVIMGIMMVNMGIMMINRDNHDQDTKETKTRDSFKMAAHTCDIRIHRPTHINKKMGSSEPTAVEPTS